MECKIPIRWHVVISVSCYLLVAPVLMHFVSPSAIGGILAIYPLSLVTWRWGKRWGLVSAAIGVALNSAIWIAVGNGTQEMSQNGGVNSLVFSLVQCLGFVAMVIMVSMKREIAQSRNLLHISQETYKNLVELSPEAACVVAEGKVVFCNTRLLEMTGYSRQEMIGTDLWQLAHSEDRGKGVEQFKTRVEDKLPRKSSGRYISKDGEVRWVEGVGHRIQWEGRPAVLYFSSDITERKLAEESLRRSEEKCRMSENKYRNLIEVAPEAITVVENGKVTFCNSQLLDMLGYSHEEMIGMEFTQLIHKDDLGHAIERYSDRMNGTLIPYITLRVVRKDGEVIWLKSVGRPIDWEGRPAVLNFSSDVTGKKRLEEQFAQAQKMEAVGRLAGGVAHDFNNMIQVILGSCSMMKGYLEDKNAILNDLEAIQDSAQRAASLTQQLLAFSRKQIVQRTVIDLRELVRQSEKMLSRVLGEDVTLKVVLGEETGCVMADTAQIQQVIMNLAINARDAMPEGGKIVISVDTVALTEATGSEIPPGRYVRLTVSDTGHGMDAGILDHVFEPFFTTKGIGKGTGLGLSIVYGIVAQWGGFIKVESSIGAGSTFTIHLPRVFEPADRGRGCAEEESQHGSGSILLVEDDASVRGLVKKILEKGGYSVTEAESGEEAIMLCRARSDEFDLLLTDIVLTGMRGGDVAAAVRALSPRIRVTYMTGYSDNDDTLQNDGAQILLKPFTAADLLCKVRGALKQPDAEHPPQDGGIGRKALDNPQRARTA